LNKLDSSSDKENSRLRNYLEKNVNNIIFLVILTAIVSLITYYRILVQIDMGPVSDSFDFLSNALVFAGQGMGYSDLLRPPLFPFIISLIFRMGYISTMIIFIVDGGLFILGVIGLYLLLKIRFNELESFIGALLYATFPIILTVLSVGFSDLASVSFSIWAIYFTVLAVRNDSKFFYLAIPFLMFAFLTRYNSALLILPILLYIIINRDKINIKKLIIGLLASILIIIPVLIFFYQKFGNIIYPFLNFGTTSTTLTVASESASYEPNILFFLQKFPAFIGAQGITIILILVLGFGVYFLLKSISKIRNNKSIFEGISLKIINNKLKLIIFAVLMIIFLGSFGMISYWVSEMLFLVLSYLFYDMTKNKQFKHLDLNILFLAWFMVFFIFHSVFIIKDNRYFVLMAPPVAYFMILGLSELSNTLKIKIRNRNASFAIFATFLTVIMLLSTASQIPLILEANNDKVTANEQMVLASQWFMNYDPNYKNENIYSDLWPNFSWYLKTNVKPVPVFKDNQTFPNGVKNYTFNQQDSNEYNKYLLTNNADYYISVRPGLNLTSYATIKQFGVVTIYQRKQ
jgi:4-amino-4-deoxy-L-arabinose transferase-like glycosyltransferase